MNRFLKNIVLIIILFNSLNIFAQDLRKVWWGYNFNTDEIENRDIDNYYFLNDNSFVKNKELDYQWIYTSSKNDIEEINYIKKTIHNAIEKSS